MPSDDNVTNGNSTHKLDPEVEEQVLALLRVGEKLRAVQIYSQHTGLGLIDAKHEIEEIMRSRGISMPTSSSVGVLAVIGIMVGVVTLVFCVVGIILGGIAIFAVR